MKELSKSESILNEYVMNTSEISSSREYIYTQQSLNNNLSLKLKSRKSSIKKTPFDKYSTNVTPPPEPNFSNLTNLINLIECNNITQLIESLENDSSHINNLNQKGLSPIHIAVINGNLEIIKILLKYGADPNIKTLHKNQTPLHLAYIFKCLISNQIINLLIKNKADINSEDINNKKPYEYYLKYKESNEVENTLSNENENEEIEISNDIQTNPKININKKIYHLSNQDSFNENKNNYTYTYSISDSEATLTEDKTKRNSGYYNIEELINHNQCNNKGKNCKFKIIDKKKGKKLYKNNGYNYNLNGESKSILNINNNYFLSKNNNLFDDSLEMKLDNNDMKNKNYIFSTKKSSLNRSYQNLQVKNNFPNLYPTYNKYKSDIKKNKEININEQYYFNNEFFNNYYSEKDLIKSKAKRRSFKIPKSSEKNMNNGLLSSSMSSTHNQTNKKFERNKNINEIKEFMYSDESNNTKNEKNLEILKNWLISIELPFYYENFINNKIYDISILIKNIKNINYEYIENLLKIHKSGHIYRILSKLEVDAGNVENKICNFLVGINNTTIDSNLKNNKAVYLQSKECYGKCYNCCETKKPLMEKRDLMTFLRKYNILHLYENFFHNGFNLINFVILQMYTKYSVNDDIVQKSFHIYKKKDRYLVLDALFNEVKEINIFFSTNIHNHCLFPKYENNDWESSWNDESINTDNDNSNKCIII